VDFGVRCAPTYVLRSWTGGEVAGSGDVADRDRVDVADRDRTECAGGGSRGGLLILLMPIYSALWALVSHGTSWGGREPGCESYFHTLVMREGSQEAEWQGASTRRFSLQDR